MANKFLLCVQGQTHSKNYVCRVYFVKHTVNIRGPPNGRAAEHRPLVFAMCLLLAHDESLVLRSPPFGHTANNFVCRVPLLGHTTNHLFTVCSLLGTRQKYDSKAHF